MNKITKNLCIFALPAILFIIFCIWQNNDIVITRSDYYNPKIPAAFNGFQIVQISDLHNKRFGKDQSILLNHIKSVSPDMIVVTGDIIDRRKFDLDTAMSFVSGAVQIAPVYFVSGNHEAWSGKYPIIKERLTKAGVHVIDHQSVKLSKGERFVHLMGLSDPDFLTSRYLEDTDVSRMKKQLAEWSGDSSFKILLSHRPELFSLYCENSMDLIFAGHAHGGQFRIPGLGGLVAPDQGFFPKYTGGSYRKNSTAMYVSRGLGNSIIPIRIFNRPEIVAVTLKAKKQ